MIIYKMTNLLNKKVYIGQTTRTLETRMLEHCRNSNILVDKAIQKYGYANFLTQIIDYADTIEELNEKEKFWIKFYDCITPKGYNQCEGGDNTCGFHHRKESKQKMSAAKSVIYVGEGNPFYNKNHSDESKQKMSEKRKGMKHLTEEQVLNLRESHYKRKVVNITTNEVFDSIKEASEKYNIPATHITRVCKGKRKRTHGYEWKYKED